MGLILTKGSDFSFFHNIRTVECSHFRIGWVLLVSHMSVKLTIHISILRLWLC